MKYLYAKFLLNFNFEIPYKSILYKWPLKEFPNKSIFILVQKFLIIKYLNKIPSNRCVLFRIIDAIIINI